MRTPTPVSLLDRLKNAGPEASDWPTVQEIYLPLIRSWLARVPGLGDEADDLGQEVFLVLLRELPRFDRRREGSFRAWLRQVTVNKARSHWKRKRRQPAIGLNATDGFLEQLGTPNGELARAWDQEHDRHVFQKLLAIVQPNRQANSLELTDSSCPKLSPIS
jgi:RNA polymerase sigma-70 factor (ECF subfamily)